MMHQSLLKDFGMIKKLGRIKIMITQENIPYTADEIKAMIRTCEKYNKARDMAKKIYNDEFEPDVAAVLAEYLPMIFPELKESKDERIRKVIYGWIYSCPSEFFDNGFSKEEMLAWVEKQGENKDLIAEIKNRKALLGAEKEKAVSSTDKLSFGARIAMLDELLAWVKKQDKENNTYTINNTPNCGISVNIYNDNEECKESKDERMKEQLCEFLHDNMLYQDAQEITSWLEKLIEKQKD